MWNSESGKKQWFTWRGFNEETREFYCTLIDWIIDEATVVIDDVDDIIRTQLGDKEYDYMTAKNALSFEALKLQQSKVSYLYELMPDQERSKVSEVYI